MKEFCKLCDSKENLRKIRDFYICEKCDECNKIKCDECIKANKNDKGDVSQQDCEIVSDEKDGDKMKIKIKIRLVKFGKAITMQILEQEGIDKGCGEIFHNDDMKLISENGIELRKNKVYIRGINAYYDDHVSIFYHKDKKERDEHYNRIVQLFKDFNNRHKEEESNNDVFVLE